MKYALTIIIVSLFTILVMPVNLHATDLEERAQKLQSFDYNKTVDFDKIETLVANQTKLFLDNKLGYDIKNWSDPYVKPNGAGGESVTNREGLKETLKEKLAENYPEQIRDYLENSLLRDMDDDPEMAARIEKLIDEIVKNTVDQLDDVIESSMDTFNTSKTFAEQFVEQMGASIGTNTKEQLESYADQQMRSSLGLDQSVDLAAYVNEKMHTAGKDLEKFHKSMTEMNPDKIIEKIDSVLKESGLPNPYNLDADDYLSLGKAAGLGLSSVSVSMPTIEIPGTAYGVIQIASGVSHFVRSVGFLFINPDEIKKGYNCLKTANWAMSDKNRAFTIVGGDLGVGGYVSGSGTSVDSGTLDKLSAITEKLGSLELVDEKAVRAEINDSIDKLGEIKVEIDKSIVESSQKLASVSNPVGVDAMQFDDGWDNLTTTASQEAWVPSLKSLADDELANSKKMLALSDGKRGETGENGGQCVAYVREYFSAQVKEDTIYGCLPGIKTCNDDLGAYNAWECWDFESGKGSTPKANSIMVIDKVPASKCLKLGHVAVVREVKENVDGTYTLTIDESNWSDNNDELIDKNVSYTYDPVDKTVKRGTGTSSFPVRGFIYGPTSVIDCNEKEEQYARQQ